MLISSLGFRQCSMAKSNGKQKLQEICGSISRVRVISAKVQKANFWVDSLNYRCTDSRLSAGNGLSHRIFQSNSTTKSSLTIWVSLYIEILDAKSRNNSGIVFGGSPIRQILDYDVFSRHLKYTSSRSCLLKDRSTKLIGPIILSDRPMPFKKCPPH